MVRQLWSVWGDLVARYGFGQVLLVIVSAVVVVAAAGMAVAGLLALRSLHREERPFPRAAGTKSRRVG